MDFLLPITIIHIYTTKRRKLFVKNQIIYTANQQC